MAIWGETHELSLMLNSTHCWEAFSGNRFRTADNSPSDLNTSPTHAGDAQKH